MKPQVRKRPNGSIRTSARRDLVAPAPLSRLGAAILPDGSVGKIGALLLLLLVWLFFELGRPAHPFGIPLVISVVSLVAWIFTRQKQWGRQTPMWLVLLAVMGLGIGFAPNTYAAFMATRNMGVLFICICLPLQAHVNSVRRVRVWIYGFLVIAAYVGGWAAFHGGFGPGGAGNYDENYVATLMGMAVGIAYFSFLAEKRLAVKALLIVAMVTFVAAMANAQDPSRGGFIALCVVGIYCVGRSPRKAMGFGLLALLGLALLAIAGPAYWAEIDTSTDYKDGTGDIRLEVWKCGLRMWKAHPFFGVGAGNFTWVIGDYQSPEQFAKFGHSLGGAIVAHSMFVEMLAELGSVGAIALIVLLWYTWTDLRSVRDAASASVAKDDIAQIRLYADGMRAGLLAVLVNGIFLSIFYYSYVWLLLAVGSAFPFIMRRILRSASGESSVAPQPAGAVAADPIRADRSSWRSAGFLRRKVRG